MKLTDIAVTLVDKSYVVGVDIHTSSPIDVLPTHSEMLTVELIVTEVLVEVSFDAAVRSLGARVTLLLRVSTVDLVADVDPQGPATVDRNVPAIAPVLYQVCIESCIRNNYVEDVMAAYTSRNTKGVID